MDLYALPFYCAAVRGRAVPGPAGGPLPVLDHPGRHRGGVRPVPGAVRALRGLIPDPAAGDQAACAAGCLLFFVSSLFLYRNNPLQKFFVALLTLCDFAFLGAFVPLFLGVLPFSTAGGLGGALSVLFTLLFSLLMGLCLYRPFHHYSDRGVSGSWRACAFCCWRPTCMPGAAGLPLPLPDPRGPAAAGGPALRGDDLLLPLPVPGGAVPGPHRGGGRPGADAGHGGR